jgi:hypothetical protein
MTVLHVTNATTASAVRPPNRVAPGLGDNDLLLEACQHLLPVGHAQTQIGDIFETIRSVNRYDVGKRLITVTPDLHQPHNPSHASTPGQTTDAKIRLWPSHSRTCDGPSSQPGRHGSASQKRRLERRLSGNPDPSDRVTFSRFACSWHTACLRIPSKNAWGNEGMVGTVLSATRWLALCGLIAVSVEPTMAQPAEPCIGASWEITGPLANTGAMLRVATETALDEINAANAAICDQIDIRHGDEP